MKKKLFFAAVALVALASCSDNEFIGDNSPTTQQENAADEIQFGLNVQNTTRAGENLIGATAAEKLGGMFVVEGTKGSEETSSPSTTVVFDNYLVGYEYNSAGKTEDNTNNWEYVGLETTGITGKLSSATWTALHTGAGTAQAQTIKYWDYSTSQYDFIAWSTGNREAVTSTAEDGKVKVTRINTGETLKTNGFQMTAVDADDLLECYYTDIITVPKANYGKPVTLTFRNMAAKVRVALYETVPGYSVKDVKFYTEDASDPTAPDDLDDSSVKTDDATLFTVGTGIALPQSGSVLVYYPHIGTSNNALADYNKASVTVTPGSATSTTQAFGALTAQYVPAEAHEGSRAVSAGDAVPSDYATKVGSAAAGSTLTAAEATAYNATISFYLGRTLPTATFAGSKAENYYQAVIPNTNGVPLTLRLDYTLVATDGSGEEIKVYGAKAVVPATYTVWQPNYAYTYVFKISDNSNGWTSTSSGDPKGLFPITFDAVVTSFIDFNAEQTTVTTVATPSITTYQQGHTTATNEYSKSQTAGISSDVKKLYVQVMDNGGAAPALVATLSNTNSLLFAVDKANASEAEVMDALQNRTNTWDAASPVGRNGITLTTAAINNAATSIVNGVDDQPITVTAGQVAEINIAALSAGTYAYVYCTTVPTADEKVFNVVSSTTAQGAPSSYYEVAVGNITATSDATAQANKVYFVANLDATNQIVSYTFKQTKVGEPVTGLYEATISAKASSYTAGNFYFDVYNKNNGAYAVKVIKVQ